MSSNPDGTSSGVFLLNSNGMDIELQENSITYRVIGGVLDFYFFMGPTPEAVIQQYQEVIGKPAMPPLWALGFHQCRWGYKTLSDVKDVVEGYKSANIPLEVMWADIDYMDRYRDFTFDSQRFNQDELRAFVDSLHAAGQKWVPITDCGIPHAADDPAFITGMEQGVFIKDVTGAPYLGQVWPGATHYPDFLSVNRTWPWWKDQLQHMWDKVPYDGMWIDMNEASNFCDGEICKLPDGSDDTAAIDKVAAAQHQSITTKVTSLFATSSADQQQRHASSGKKEEVATSASAANCALQCTPPAATDTLANPPYPINNLQKRVHLGSKTLPVTARHVGGELEYDAHNLYGLSEAAATRLAMEKIIKKRPFVLSRSTFPGAGRHAAHWTGDNAATWDDLLWSISGLLNSNMWGIPLAGADICGFQGDANEELCARWIQAGAFYTFTRNHNSINSKPQELYLWPTAAEASRKALAMRYSLLPYLYTAFYKVHVDGGTVAKPLFFAFPADEQARDTYKQWLLGDSILISPVLTPSTTQLTAYFPEGSWYNIWNQDYSHIRGPETATLDVPLTDTAVHVRGGSIVALQEPKNTTEEVRKSPIRLVIALDQAGPDSSSSSSSSGRDSVQGYSGFADSDGVLRPGVQLGCGMLYLDDGESLEVPPRGADASLTVLFSSMSLQGGRWGWVVSTPADQLQQQQIQEGITSSSSTSSKQGRMDPKQQDITELLAVHHKHCMQRNVWPKQSDQSTTTHAAAGSQTAANQESKSDSKQAVNALSSTGDSIEWPKLSEVVILGVAAPAGHEASTAAATAVDGDLGSGGDSSTGLENTRFTVNVNGQQLSNDQVFYDAERSVLHATGLHVSLTEEVKVEWQFAAMEPA